MIICHAMTQTHDTVIEGKIADCIIVENKNIENSNFTNYQQLLTLETNLTIVSFFCVRLALFIIDFKKIKLPKSKKT